MAEINQLNKQRKALILRIEQTLEGPMVILGFIWLILLIIELIRGLSDSLQMLSSAIWIIFIIDFLLKFALAPEKLKYLKTNSLTAVSLIIPGLRFIRILRFARLLKVFRGTRLIKVISSLNRSMKSLNATMQRRGFGYVMLLSTGVVFAGAAGMFAFENIPGGLQSYGSALWWTIMLIITIGSDYWPHTAEGRILCVLLSLYGFGVFGYITATLASFFVGRDAEEKDAPVAGSEEIKQLRKEISRLNEILIELKDGKNGG